jgi:Putative adhesin
MGKPALAFGGIALIGAGIAVGLGWWWRESAETNAVLSQPIHSVRIDLDSGDVTIRAGNVEATSIRQHFSYRRDRPGDTYRVSGDQLVLGECGSGCSVDYQIVVPLGTVVTGASKSGHIEVDGAAGIDVSTKSGEVRVTDSTGPVKVETSSGNVDITLRTAQDVHARAGGDLRVTVPNDRFRVQGDSGSGERDIEIVQDPAAPHVLDLSTTSGDVTARIA